LLAVSGLAVLFVLFGNFLPSVRPSASAATVFVVNSTGDGFDANPGDGICDDGTGHCTLRAAMREANVTPGTDTINFNIGAGPQTIAPASALPTITDPVVIDGTTQPGFAGSPIIELDGTNTGGGEGLAITAGSSIVRGLVINRFYTGVSLYGNGGNKIEGNYIGTNLAGNASPSSSSNLIYGLRVASTNNMIGGTTPAKRNVISGNGGDGIEILGLSGNGQGATGNVVQGNYIGTDATGNSAVPNRGEHAVRVYAASGNTIGGTAPGAGNVISGNSGNGVTINDTVSNGNSVLGNLIGVAADGVTPLPNNLNGINLPNAVNTVIGGTTSGAANVIANNKWGGIIVAGNAPPLTLSGYNNAIRGNSIYGNARIGIALSSPFAPTPNDAGDSDAGGNNLQNYPVINSVSLGGNTTNIQGTLNSTAGTVFNLDFFSNSACDASGSGEGKTYLGSVQTTTDGSGNVSFNVNLPTALQAERVVTATATDPNGNTSEFSPCNLTLFPGQLQFSAASYNVIEDIGQATITVTRTNGTSGQVSVDYATSNGTATAGTDYTAASGTLTFADGETAKTFTVPILNDAINEPDETLNLALSNPAGGAALGAQNTAVLNLLDRSKLPVLSIDSTSVNEGNAGTTGALVTVSLSAATGRTVTANYNTFEVSSTSGVDFQPASGSLTFLPGVTSQTLEVAAIGDTLDEDNEQFRVALSNAVNAAVSVSSNPPVVTIIDDDPLPSLSINDATVTEGNSGTVSAVFTVTLSAASGRSVTVGYGTSNGGTAISPGDFQQAAGTLTFAPGQTSQTVSIAVVGDTSFEGNEYFHVNLFNEFNATIARSQGVGNIIDDDAFPTLSVDDVIVIEDDSGYYGDRKAVFTVSLSAPSNQQVTFWFNTESGTALSAGDAAEPGRADFGGVSGADGIFPGVTTRKIEVPIYGDLTDEPDETFKLVIYNSYGATIARARGTATIQDNDPPPSLSISDARVGEGDAGTSSAVLTVNLSSASGKTVTVDYATSDGTATSGGDYQPSSGTLTFNPYETSKTVTIPVNGDTLDESNETFFVNLAAPNNATLGDAQAVATIIDNEGPTELQFTDATYSAGESTGRIVATVFRSGDASGTATVDYATTDGTASQRNDYTTAVGTLTFAAGQISKTITVIITDDLYIEGNDTINLTLNNPTGASLTTSASATLSIIDNDVQVATTNPIDDARFFVRQNYADFLSREPDQGGLDYWTERITQCGSNPSCINFWRSAVSAAFFIELEFQNTGSFVYRTYKASYGVRPTYAQFTPDRARLVDSSNLEQNKLAFAQLFVQRPEFIARYPLSLDGPAFVDALLQSVQQSSGVNLAGQREALVSAYTTAGGGVMGRASVLRQLADNGAFTQAEYNRAFVQMQYFGFLKRDPDEGGYQFWLSVVNNSVPNDPSGYRSMVCAFITSPEYQQRFSQVVTRNDTVCAPQ
jgi:CSLREA domain-containing protein